MNEIEQHNDTVALGQMQPSEREDDFSFSLSSSLIGISLMDQINAPFPTSNVDHLRVIREKINYLRATFPDEVDAMNDLKKAEHELYSVVITTLLSKLGVEEANVDMDLLSDLRHKAKALYSFMILNRNANIINYFYTHIFNKRKQFAASVKVGINKRDMVVSNLRKQFASFDNVAIFYSIADIIDLIGQENSGQEDVLKRIIEGEEELLDNINIVDLFENVEIKDLYASYINAFISDPANFNRLTIELRAKFSEIFEKK
jgi:hypothetical protein